jgi:plasmid stability protein
MICQFCKQEVDNPCHEVHELRQRAISHVERCEDALREVLRDGVNPSDGQSAGSI